MASPACLYLRDSLGFSAAPAPGPRATRKCRGWTCVEGLHGMGKGTIHFIPKSLAGHSMQNFREGSKEVEDLRMLGWMMEIVCCARPRATTIPSRLVMMVLRCALATFLLRVTAAWR